MASKFISILILNLFTFSFSITITNTLTTTTTKFDLTTLTLTNLKLLGEAQVTTNNTIRLTPELPVPNSSAGKFLYSKPIKLPTSFSTSFSFSITNLNPSSIGGGLAFLVSADDRLLGDPGPYLGFSSAVGTRQECDSKVLHNCGTENLLPAVIAVEYDTLMDVEFGDINGNHVGLDFNNSMFSSRVCDLENVGVDLKSGNLVNSWVDYSKYNRLFQVYVSYSNVKPEKAVIVFESFDLDAYFENDFVYVGFSGSTQGSTEVHTVVSWSFTSFFDEIDTVVAPSVAPVADDYGNYTTLRGSRKCRGPLCKDGTGAVFGVLTAGGFILVFCGMALLVWGYRKKFKSGERSITLGSSVMVNLPREFSYKELRFATKGFDSSRSIGQGAFGMVYKGVLQETGDIVAVKRCSHSGQQGKAEFLSELSIIGSLRHRNLVRLQGWCQEKGEILLVYDMMSNGSLDKALFESRMVLAWPHRRKILIGVASALAYLHQECENQVIHRDIKSSNIMLDEGFNARLGDFGLARQIEHDKSPDATVAAGTMGYLAPEYLLTGRATDKTDVFSYGAVVLEVASGRRPIEKEVTGVGKVGVSSNLVEWVWSLHREGRLMAAVDPRLGNEFDEVEMRRVLMVGLACSHPDPMARPSMRSVVQMLDGEAEVPIVPRTKPTMTFSTAQLLMTLQDSVSDLNGMITISTTSSENSFDGVGGGDHHSVDLV